MIFMHLPLFFFSFQALQWAVVGSNYRMIDTAKFYENEREIGNWIKTSPVPREELFIVSKLWTSDHGYQRALNAFQK